MASLFTPFDYTLGNLGAGNLRLGSDQIYCYLTNNTPDLVNHAYKSDLAEIAAGNGYSAGGVLLTGVTWALQAGSPQGIWVLDANTITFTAAGGDIAQARYAVLYDLGVGSPNQFLLGYADYGSAFQITNGNSLSILSADGFLELLRG